LPGEPDLPLSPAGSNGDESPQFVVTAQPDWCNSFDPAHGRLEFFQSIQCPCAEFLTLPHARGGRVLLAVQESAFSYLRPFLAQSKPKLGPRAGELFPHSRGVPELPALVMDFCGTGGVASR